MKIPNSIILQIAVWSSIWVLFISTSNSAEQTYQLYLAVTLRVLGFALYFNIAYYALLPYYFAGKKRAFYLLSLLAFVGYLGFSIMTDLYFFELAKKYEQTEKQGEHPPERPLAWLLIPPTFVVIALFGAAATFRGFSAFEAKKVAEEEANRRRLEAEIALLKSQINPHFLLNTLNNLYALSLTEPDKTPESLLKLSDMMNYLLHEGAQLKVPLTHDLAFVQNYIELQRLRLPPNVSLRVKLPSDTPDNLQIEPMVLIPFIENAFKHGLTTKIACEISIAISLAERQLRLWVENPVLPIKTPSSGNPSGVGMLNTRQRLAHTYPGRHQLLIKKDELLHRVELEINLEK